MGHGNSSTNAATWRRSVPTGALFAADIANRHNVSVQAARRWLARIEKTYGPAIVGRVGGGGERARRFTTEAALAKIHPDAARRDESLEGCVVELTEKYEELLVLVDRLRERIERVERKLR